MARPKSHKTPSVESSGRSLQDFEVLSVPYIYHKGYHFVIPKTHNGKFTHWKATIPHNTLQNQSAALYAEAPFVLVTEYRQYCLCR
ncbi:hypothetical protein CEXT_270101 [Caerostris extrusa]|uniref:Uncharacterized protein n=1 Tax=Caerostris extrusa TaxID=172846 RepID=A0AAV4X7X7_CAEEX|nr:hypothetical protein CEXT_270101 [Caerostris extrusa]